MSEPCASEVTASKVFSAQHLLQVLLALPNASRYWLAYSGGLDSHVLLHAMASLRPSLPGVELRAVHVDHGLQAKSAEWSTHCKTVCQTLHIPYQLLYINAHPATGESPEAAARHARYAAIAALVEEGDCLFTAHHQDDQAETLILQLLRGAGPHGLASMPLCTPFTRGLHARPLLSYTRAELSTYAEQHELCWIDDQSNLSTAFDRNYLRHEIMPRLRARWPALARTLSRSASHAAEAAQLMDRLAKIDLLTAGIADEKNNLPLSITVLSTLDKVRQANVLRVWIKQQNLPLPSATHIEHIIKDMLTAAWDSTPRIAWPGAEVRRYRDLIYAMTPLPPNDTSLCFDWDMEQPLALPDGTQLFATTTQGVGLNASLCHGQKITIRFRQGGERCQPVGRAHTHELKKLFQEYGIPTWLRDHIPLIYRNDTLAAVANLWICQPFQALSNEAGILIKSNFR